MTYRRSGEYVLYKSAGLGRWLKKYKKSNNISQLVQFCLLINLKYKCSYPFVLMSFVLIFIQNHYSSTCCRLTRNVKKGRVLFGRFSECLFFDRRKSSEGDDRLSGEKSPKSLPSGAAGLSHLTWRRARGPAKFGR